jgi:hypothetical protein
MTDLVLGLPVYVSSKHGGMLYRRLSFEPSELPGEIYEMQTADVPARTIAEIVRASAGFPGIPPRRFRMPDDPANPAVAQAPSVAYLADGGLWNNLGSQVLREDQFLGSNAAPDEGTLRPYQWVSSVATNMPLLVVNGSAPLKPSWPGVYRIPGLALLAALVQTSRILSPNTVVPRITAMKQSFQRRLGARVSNNRSQ